ncbi:DnaJ domain-containing protein [Haliea sp. E1-2-M8]|uniref:DnaJ domain-containing protein n=1 Tax=Haliea sp. E1-2-M8 TaxID=3064706 RepID=UPI00272464CC|nr:DnaJ domain-containing protein [Haliea sp. E1-2-M8]MDO8862430.1 DnaJ domain-containing protein [Haliea sp. E1-2-M8]
MIPELLPTALAFYRAPGQYAQLRDARVPLPAGVTELLAAHAHALAPEQIDDTAARLGSSPQECHAAVIFFIKQALLEARGDYYRTLGVARDADSALIRQHYHYLIRLFHPDRDLDSEGWETLYAPAINEAWNQLRTPAKRGSYDAGLPPPDAFDAVLARGREANSGTAATARASAAGARTAARPLAGILAGLSPRLVLGLLFGLPLLLVLLWLIAKPAPQELRIADREPALGASGKADTRQTRPITEADRLPGVEGTAAGQGGDTSARSAPATRTAPRRATSAELEQRVRERLATATSAVRGPGAATRPRRQAGQPAASTAAEPIVRTPEDTRQSSLPESKAGESVVAAAKAKSAALPRLAQFSETVSEPAPGPRSDPDPGPAPLSEPNPGLEFETVAVAEPAPEAESVPASQAAIAPAVGQPPAIQEELHSSPAPAPGLPALDGAQLGAVVAAFARSYEAGDAQHFSALFAENADTSDARGRAAIRDLYSGFFARPETREIRFGQMLWEYHSPFHSRGTGPARVTTVPLDGGEPASGELMITLEVEQTPAGPAIVALYYH